jgi:hypothetical protein
VGEQRSFLVKLIPKVRPVGEEGVSQVKPKQGDNSSCREVRVGGRGGRVAQVRTPGSSGGAALQNGGGEKSW